MCSSDLKTALVTGGSRGIGLMIARGFVDAGVKVYISSRKAEVCDAVAAELSQTGTCISLPADLSEPEENARLAREVAEREDRLHILVNNAGATWGAPAEDHPLEAWDKVMNLNVRGYFLLSQAVAKRCMIPRGRGRILNVASIAGLGGNPAEMQTIAYNTSKGAVVDFTRALAGEWGRHGITVNAICPGYINTEMVQAVPKDVLEKSILPLIPIGRLGEPEEIAAMIAPARAGGISGQCSRMSSGAMVSWARAARPDAPRGQGRARVQIS